MAYREPAGLAEMREDFDALLDKSRTESNFETRQSVAMQAQAVALALVAAEVRELRNYLIGHDKKRQ
jgi:hypothetical protein